MKPINTQFYFYYHTPYFKKWLLFISVQFPLLSGVISFTIQFLESWLYYAFEWFNLFSNQNNQSTLLRLTDRQLNSSFSWNSKINRSNINRNIKQIHWLIILHWLVSCRCRCCCSMRSSSFSNYSSKIVNSRNLYEPVYALNDDKENSFSALNSSTISKSGSAAESISKSRVPRLENLSSRNRSLSKQLSQQQ